MKYSAFLKALGISKEQLLNQISYLTTNENVFICLSENLAKKLKIDTFYYKSFKIPANESALIHIQSCDAWGDERFFIIPNQTEKEITYIIDAPSFLFNTKLYNKIYRLTKEFKTDIQNEIYCLPVNHNGDFIITITNNWEKPQ